jgi:stringent starvation protein B
MEEVPTKPYLMRALFEWCVDNGYTPHIAVKVDSRTQVPAEFVKNGEITLNIAPGAVHKLQIGNDQIEFSARFAGVARQISVPVANVHSIYARETGHGMTFETGNPGPVVQPAADAGSGALEAAASAEPEPPKPNGTRGRPVLRRVK